MALAQTRERGSKLLAQSYRRWTGRELLSFGAMRYDASLNEARKRTLKWQ